MSDKVAEITKLIEKDQDACAFIKMAEDAGSEDLKNLFKNIRTKIDLDLREIVSVQPMTLPVSDLPFIFHTPTPEEQEQNDRAFAKIKKTREAIRVKHPIGREFIEDTIPCPCCENGIVSFIISDHYNGHIHAKCSNGCVNWME